MKKIAADKNYKKYITMEDGKKYVHPYPPITMEDGSKFQPSRSPDPIHDNSFPKGLPISMKSSDYAMPGKEMNVENEIDEVYESRPAETKEVGRLIGELTLAIERSTEKLGDRHADDFLVELYYDLFQAIQDSGLNVSHFASYVKLGGK